MIYTVTFNPSLDYIVTVDSFLSGSVNRTRDEKLYAGGKGINVSMVLDNLGIENTSLGFLAGFTGREILNLLNEKGVHSDFIFADKGISRINIKLRSNQESEINGKGPVIGKKELEKLYEKLDHLKEDDILVLAGSVCEGMSDSVYMDIMSRLSEKKLKVIVDATKDLLVNVLKYHPFLIKPNNHELGDIFGVTIKERKDVITYAKKLQEKGAENVLVSMAGDGAVLLTKDHQIYETEAPKGIVKNSVGAGDSMVAGFVAGYAKKKDYKEAFKMGVCTGSASAFSEELATKEQVEELLKRHYFKFEEEKL